MLWGKFSGKHVGNNIMVCSLLGKPCGRLIVFSGGRGIGKRSSIFMNSKTHNSGLIRRNRNALFSDQACKQGSSRTDLPDDLYISMDILLRIGVVIIDVDLNTLFVHQFSKFPNPTFLPGVNEDQPFDTRKINLFCFGKIEKI